MSGTVKGKDCIAMQWYCDSGGERAVCLAPGWFAYLASTGNWFTYTCQDLEVTHLPDCTGPDWQPPALPDPGPEHRLIDAEVDEPRRDDERWDGQWKVWSRRHYHGDPFHRDTVYRRRLPPPEPTHRPFRDAAEFLPHADRKLRMPNWATGIFTRVISTTRGSVDILHCEVVERHSFRALFDDGWHFADTNTPAGVEVTDAKDPA